MSPYKNITGYTLLYVNGAVPRPLYMYIYCAGKHILTKGVGLGPCQEKEMSMHGYLVPVDLRQNINRHNFLKHDNITCTTGGACISCH